MENISLAKGDRRTAILRGNGAGKGLTAGASGATGPRSRLAD
jgi:hypothetical protein